MIESIYSKENGKLKEWSKSNVMFRMPKNIRQIGKINGNKKVYVEDYVITYVKQLAKNDSAEETLAVLLGQYIKIDNSKNIFISGAIRIKVPRDEQVSVFTNEIWTSIYEDIKYYFTDIEIVGWFYTKPGNGLEINDAITKLHLDNFAGQDKTLLVYDSAEDDETFYVYDNNKLTNMEGYYIYYEKNEEMQNYMVETNKKENAGSEAEYDDKAIREMRNILAAKQEAKEETAAEEEVPERKRRRIIKNLNNTREIINKGKPIRGRTVPFLYGASTLLAVTVLVIGAAVLDNYDKMRNVEEALGVISENISNSTDAKDIEATNNIGGDEVTEVETVSGQIKNADADGESLTPDVAVNNSESTSAEEAEDIEGSSEETPPAKSTMQEFDDSSTNKSNEENTSEKSSSENTSEESTDTSNQPEDSDKAKNDTKSSQDKSVDPKKNDSNKDSQEVQETSSTETRYYIVKEGDTLAGISAKIYKTIHRVEDLIKANNLKDKDKILIGQKLIVP